MRTLPVAALAALAVAACSNTAPPPNRSAESVDEKAVAATRTALPSVTTPITVSNVKKTVSLTSWTAASDARQWSCTADDEFRLPECKPTAS